MIEQIGNLWDFHSKGEWICITTNGTVKKNGEAVMGRGCALECKQRYSDFPSKLGELLLEFGNDVFVFFGSERIITLPVKHNWWEKADIKLIEQSLIKLVSNVDDLQYSPHGKQTFKLYMPRPGCGNGHLDWKSQVKPLCQKYLDDRFIVLTKTFDDDFDMQIVGK